jgi:Holliday junction resolvase RusA-like endonuclease
MTKRGKWVSPAAQRYLSYKDAIGYQLRQHHKKSSTEYAVAVKIKFIMPIPPGWSKIKQQKSIGQYHTKKPDIDNLIKGLFDAANGIIWKDDNLVVDCKAVKVYGLNPGIEFEVEDLF